MASHLIFSYFFTHSFWRKKDLKIESTNRSPQFPIHITCSMPYITRHRLLLNFFFHFSISDAVKFTKTHQQALAEKKKIVRTQIWKRIWIVSIRLCVHKFRVSTLNTSNFPISYMAPIIPPISIQSFCLFLFVSVSLPLFLSLPLYLVECNGAEFYLTTENQLMVQTDRLTVSGRPQKLSSFCNLNWFRWYLYIYLFILAEHCAIMQKNTLAQHRQPHTHTTDSNTILPSTNCCHAFMKMDLFRLNETACGRIIFPKIRLDEQIHRIELASNKVDRKRVVSNFTSSIVDMLHYTNIYL